MKMLICLRHKNNQAPIMKQIKAFVINSSTEQN